MSVGSEPSGAGSIPIFRVFSRRDSLGNYAGFDIDFCRAVAAAALGDDTAFEPVPVTSGDRFEALIGGRIDVLSRNTTWTLDRDARYGVFVGTSFYDGQGFMVRRSAGVRSALELDNRSICVDRGSTTELNAVDFFVINEMRYRPVYFGDQADAATGYLNDECEALTTDRSALVGMRATTEEPRAHELLPEVVSKEPLGPMVPADDEQWEDIVRWSFHCLVNAEELGVTSENVGDEAFVGTPARQRLTGQEGNAGEVLGLDPGWCARIVEQVGNYAEIYERHLGTGSSIDPAARPQCTLDERGNPLCTPDPLRTAPAARSAIPVRRCRAPANVLTRMSRPGRRTSRRARRETVPGSGRWRRASARR